ncbi:MAG TPA: polysaccharide deacetylase family protein [Flavobacteriaceae bacterium]|nr:polysaccharide deacetylase family protein [Flavobacteriaceae bacterium]
MNLTPVKTPAFVKHILPDYVWNIPTKEKVLYLTFDDGPTPEITTWVLEQLKAYAAKATFFCIGNNVEKHPDIFQQVLQSGHAIGNHTHNHLKGWKVKTGTYLENVALAEKVINFQFSNSKFQETEIVNLFRPPYGKLKPKQGKALLEKGYEIIMWDVLSFDWDQTVSEENCLKNVLTKSKPGSIIVFHDSMKAAKNMQYALPKVLKHFSNAGYTFKVLPC